MSHKEIVIDCIRQSVDAKNLEISEASLLIEDLGLDSLEIFSIIVCVEEKLDRHRAGDKADMSRIISVGDIIAFIKNF